MLEPGNLLLNQVPKPTPRLSTQVTHHLFISWPHHESVQGAPGFGPHARQKHASRVHLRGKVIGLNLKTTVRNLMTCRFPSLGNPHIQSIRYIVLHIVACFGEVSNIFDVCLISSKTFTTTFVKCPGCPSDVTWEQAGMRQGVTRTRHLSHEPWNLSMFLTTRHGTIMYNIHTIPWALLNIIYIYIYIIIHTYIYDYIYIYTLYI